MIKIINANGQEETFGSITGSVRELGLVNSPVNKASALRILAKNGYDIDSIVEIEGSSSSRKSSGTRKTKVSSHVIIKNLIAKATTIDTDKVKTLTDEINTRILNIKTGDDIEEIKKLSEELNQAQNPVVTLESILKLVETMYNEYQADLQEQEEQEQEQENE